MENKEDVKYATVGSILEYLQNGIKTGKFTADTPILGESDEFFYIYQLKEPCLRQIQEMKDDIEDYVYHIDRNIQRHKEALDEAKTLNAIEYFVAYNEAQLKKAEEEKAEFESWVKQNAVVFN